MKINELNANQAISAIHTAWGSGTRIALPVLSQLTGVITRAAMVDQDQAAINWLFLLNWKPQQMVN